MIRSLRILLMLVAVWLVGLVAVFHASPDIGFVENYIESNLKQELQTDDVDVAQVTLRWQSGFALDFGKVQLTTPKLSIQDSHLMLVYSPWQWFSGAFAPELKLIGGDVRLNLDIEQAQKSEAVYITTTLQDVRLTWVLHQQVQTFERTNATIAPYASDIRFNTDHIDLSIVMDDDQLESLHLNMRSLAGLPATWSSYVQGLDMLHLRVQKQADDTWSWAVKTEADKGMIHIADAHMRLPFSSLKAQGDIQLSAGEQLQLTSFQAKSLQWRDGDNFGDFKLNWGDGVLHIDALDGSTTMPMLWSWLWMLGDDEWHDWLSSMQHGRLKDVRATLDLVWPQPMQAAPTHENLLNMTYHVTTKAFGADMALGLEGDYLYDVSANVEIDEHGLQADISHAVLNDNVGTVAGDYRIAWDTLLMEVEAQGDVDVGKLHTWLDKDSAYELQWGDAPAKATVHMLWNANNILPDTTLVHLSPTKPWQLAPKGTSLTVYQGVAVWDFQRGLDLKDMQVELPWLQGRLTMFLDKHKDWSLQQLSLQGQAPLAKLTEQFVLPIIEPQGDTMMQLDYQQGTWSGHLDFTHNDWHNFAGYDKKGNEPIRVLFSGEPTSQALLPIHISHIQSKHEGFLFQAGVLIDEHELDFHFTQVDTPAMRGSFRLLMPFDETRAWGLEAKADYIDKPLLTRYLKDRGEAEEFVRPWHVFADAKWVEWEKSHAENLHIQFSSDKHSVGQVSASRFLSGDADLENVQATFSITSKGKYDLHLLQAQGSGQTLQASGSVVMQDDGALKWQGMALMQGQFGTLMKQAELDKLFREGEMSALFLGQGEYKDGEPWWRKIKGNFKLRVDDGRMMEGGTVTRLLAAISLVDLPKYLVFQRGDVIGSGLLYDKMQIEARMDDHTLDIKELAFTSSALDAGGQGMVNLKTGELDILLVARPWQNIEAIVGSIPLLGYILTGEDKSLLRKVYRIHGPASDAAVDELDPKDAGLPRSGFLEELFSLPSKWFGDSKSDKE